MITNIVIFYAFRSPLSWYQKYHLLICIVNHSNRFFSSDFLWKLLFISCTMACISRQFSQVILWMSAEILKTANEQTWELTEIHTPRTCLCYHTRGDPSFLERKDLFFYLGNWRISHRPILLLDQVVCPFVLIWKWLM